MITATKTRRHKYFLRYYSFAPWCLRGENKMKAFKANVTGKVQGVWFRDSTCKIANKLNVAGWVKNMPDGTVYLEAEGEDNDLDALIKWIHVGSPHSHVDRVDLQWSEPTNTHSTFEVIF